MVIKFFVLQIHGWSYEGKTEKMDVEIMGAIGMEMFVVYENFPHQDIGDRYGLVPMTNRLIMPKNSVVKIH